MNDFLLAVRSGFGFLSTIPVGLTMEGLDEFFKRTYLHIFVGAFLGLLMGIFAFLTIMVLPQQISAIMIVVFVYYLTGLNHLDGLADFGDGLTAHGSVEKKIRALKDIGLGIGGVGFCTMGILAFYSSIVSLRSEALVFSGNDMLYTAKILLCSMLVAEVSAMQCMLTIAAFGKSLHEGLGSILVQKTTLPKYVVGLTGSVIICSLALIPLGIWHGGLIALIAAIISAFIILNISNRHFGGMNGDVIGTSNEIGRTVALIVIVLVLSYQNGGIPWML
ncbi:adenosylcobinamide-GDP ribazoletransferase [Methanomethylovorans sp.]|uniref:adenosylcobinamide-GDP ribazoletransferase n=1 Tax=Methanomethylovorans sp. TaxID=2758717 RepID=UPI000AD26D1E|nr:adenosylcobinamide-GDP ribazoletransferase [Methanomethylovorans sp.]